MRIVKLGLAAASFLLMANSAKAAVTFTSTPFDLATPPGKTIVEDFDHPIASGFTFTGGNLETGSTVSVAADPYGDPTQYDAVFTGQAATLTSTHNLASLGVYLGSIDAYNTISFYDNGAYVGGFGGAQLTATPGEADGDQSSSETNRLYDFSFGGAAVNEVVFSSSGNSFEFDNISAAVSPAPEPGSWLLMIAGLGGVGLMLRQARIGLRLRVADVLGA